MNYSKKFLPKKADICLSHIHILCPVDWPLHDTNGSVVLCELQSESRAVLVCVFNFVCLRMGQGSPSEIFWHYVIQS